MFTLSTGSFVFIGTESADTLIGSSNGNNIISGGGGGDRLTGGGSSDTFVFKAVTDSMPGSFDTIANFDHGADHIDLTAISGADSNFNSLPATPTSIATHTIDIVATGGNTVIYVNASGSAQTIGISDKIHLTNVTNVTLQIFLSFIEIAQALLANPSVAAMPEASESPTENAVFKLG